MNRPIILLIIPIFFAGFFSWSNSDMDFHGYIDYSHGNEPTLVITTDRKKSEGGNLYQSEGGNFKVGVSARPRVSQKVAFQPNNYKQQNYQEPKNDFSPELASQWLSGIYHKVKNLKSRNDWSNFFTKLTGCAPKEWTKSDRKAFFYEFRLYGRSSYPYFLMDFPEYLERIYEINQQASQDKKFAEKLNNHYVTYKWWGGGDKSVFSYIREREPEARCYMRNKKFQEEQCKQKEQASRRKIKSQKPVRDLFLNQKSDVVAHKERIIEQSFSGNIQKRTAAIQKAINEEFRISIQRHELTGQAAKLLKQRNIDPKFFDECVGNAIQQEAHAEFVEILNKGVDLVSSEETQRLTHHYFDTVGNFSFVGVKVNNAGRYDIAYKISDMCHDFYHYVKSAGTFLSKVYDEGKRFAEYFYHDTCQSYKQVADAFQCIFNAMASDIHQLSVHTKDAFRNIVGTEQEIGEFASGVLDKAFKRPFRFLGNALRSCMKLVGKHGALEACIKHDYGSPQTEQQLKEFQEKYCEPLNNAISSIVRMTGTTVQNLFIAAGRMGALEQVVKYDFYSENTTRMHEEFMRDCIDPLNKKVVSLIEAFNRIPNTEKAQEISAFLLQMGIARSLQMTSEVMATEGFEINLGALAKQDISISGGGQALAGVSLPIPVPGAVSTGVATALNAGAQGALAAPGVSFFMGDDSEFGDSVRGGDEIGEVSFEISDRRRQHILYGDESGGGHMWPGREGKSIFPKDWDAQTIIGYVKDIAEDSALEKVWTRGRHGSLFTMSGGFSRYYVQDVRGGTLIRVVLEPAGEGIITAFPICR